MKRFLMRGGASPLDTFSVDEVNSRNLIGGNVGNYLYCFGVFRTLFSEEVEIDMDYYRAERGLKDDAIAEINEKYDGYICPLADAFREEYKSKLAQYAKFFDKLTIPVYIIGIGCRTPYEPDVTHYTFDEEAKMFVKAVLNKGTILGLRGEITGSYLKHLGFTEGTDYRVIGCPSLYTFGRTLPQRPLNMVDGKLGDDTKVSLNMSWITPVNVQKVIAPLMKRFDDYYLVEQGHQELALLYYGVDFVTNKQGADSLLPMKITHPIFAEDRYKVFINVKTWFDYMQGRDLSVGSKLHGNVAAVINGCPSLFFTLDGRMRELVDYHSLPAIPYCDIKGDESLEELIAKVDMQSHIRNHSANFDRYIDFLDANGLDHIYKNDRDRVDSPIDALMSEKDYPIASCILNESKEDAIARFNMYHKALKKENANLKKQKKSIKNDMADLSSKHGVELAKAVWRLKKEYGIKLL